MSGAAVRRIVLIGGAASELCVAAGMARELGADVRLVGTEVAVATLADAKADLAMVEVSDAAPALIAELRAEVPHVPLLACGVDAPASQAVRAVRAGCFDYVPLPPDREMIAAILHSLGARQTAPIEPLVGQTVDDVERELILRTLERCGGNRTSASTILGISVRTMRNKLRSFIDAGYAVSPAA